MTLARKGHWTTVVGLVLLGGVYVRAVVFTPVERLQGPAQKIFYLHVPAAVWTELAMVLVGVASVVFLFLKDPRLDRFAEASAEVGTVFAAIVLTTGPIWGKTVWGTWWAWDARLTSTLFLFFLYIGYLLLRGAVVDAGARARYAAVLGICGMARSEEHTSELQSLAYLVCRLLLEKKKAIVCLILLAYANAHVDAQ